MGHHEHVRKMFTTSSRSGGEDNRGRRTCLAPAAMIKTAIHSADAAEHHAHARGHRPKDVASAPGMSTKGHHRLREGPTPAGGPGGWQGAPWNKGCWRGVSSGSDPNSGHCTSPSEPPAAGGSRQGGGSVCAAPSSCPHIPVLCPRGDEGHPPGTQPSLSAQGHGSDQSHNRDQPANELVHRCLSSSTFRGTNSQSARAGPRTRWQGPALPASCPRAEDVAGRQEVGAGVRRPDDSGLVSQASGCPLKGQQPRLASPTVRPNRRKAPLSSTKRGVVRVTPDTEQWTLKHQSQPRP